MDQAKGRPARPSGECPAAASQSQSFFSLSTYEWIGKYVVSSYIRTFLLSHPVVLPLQAHRQLEDAGWARSKS
jgi:hypothetical protein